MTVRSARAAHDPGIGPIKLLLPMILDANGWVFFFFLYYFWASAYKEWRLTRVPILAGRFSLNLLSRRFLVQLLVAYWMKFRSYNTTNCVSVNSEGGIGETSWLLSKLNAINWRREPILPGMVPLNRLFDKSLWIYGKQTDLRVLTSTYKFCMFARLPKLFGMVPTMLRSGKELRISEPK